MSDPADVDQGILGRISFLAIVPIIVLELVLDFLKQGR
jgi:hypothetical protein